MKCIERQLAVEELKRDRTKMPKKNESEPKREQPEDKPNFNEEQYKLLKSCSKKKDLTDWNIYREEHPGEKILLEGADLEEDNLQSAYLKGANLQGAKLREAHLENADLLLAHLENAILEGAHLEGAKLRGAHLENAELWGAHLEGANLSGAHLEGAELWEAHLEGARLHEAHLENANLREAHLEGAKLREAHLENAELHRAHLENAYLEEAHLDGAKLRETHLENANLTRAYLQDANFSRAIVDGKTLIWDCDINRKTKFAGVGLGNIRIYSNERQLLEYNIRRMNWEEWYPKQHWSLRWLVRKFWQISNYGFSTGRIITTFFGLAILFAIIYYFAPSLVADLHVTGNNVLDFIRACYFSIVTMTTLGFGDMYANRESWAGHILLIVQVLLGYILLAALVTRFAVLFTAGGPAGEFTKKTAKSEGRRAKDEEGRRTEGGWRMADDGGRMTDDGGRRTEGGGRRAEGGRAKGGETCGETAG